MPVKRKALSSAQGGTKAGKTSKVSTPGPSTPQSLGSSDEYSDGPDSRSDSERENITKAVEKFSVSKRPATKPVNTIKGRDSASRHFGNNDFSYVDLKPDHDNRPMWIDPQKGKITVETFMPLSEQCQDFLTEIAEPLSRPSFVHEWKITAHSLYAAVSIGLTKELILSGLNTFSKTPVPEDLRKWVVDCTSSFGKVKLVLKNTKYYVESTDPEMLQRLLKDEVIGPLRVRPEDGITTSAAPKLGGLVIPGTKEAAGMAQQLLGSQVKRDAEGANVTQEDIFAKLNEDDEDDDDEAGAVHAFEIGDENVETVQKRCLQLGLPILEEYDFQNDAINANLEIDLRPAAQIRPYQEKSLAKMFSNGRSKSGIIVLPCGAGKTLVGITAACTIKKSIIVLTTGSMSAVQWQQEFLKWSNVKKEDVALFTADNKIRFSGNAGIIVTTYTMISAAGKRSYDTQKMLDWLTSREWGLMILDEVHVVPAQMFRKVTSTIKTHAKLGLTATLLREDDKIEDLNFLIGPKLYEANWMELAEKGHIAKVQCAEVWCPMTTEFYSEYLRASSKKRQIIYAMNPSKFQACQFLINYHEKRGDKIIVFSDNVYSLTMYATALNKVYIYGQTSQSERIRILENFQHNPNINTLFLSKIGDTSIDLPEATCLIQISSHYGSRRQEAQRLGRILRAKRRNDEGFNAFFYSLVSTDTEEMYYSSKRQAFLVDQGYAFKCITHLAGMQDLKELKFKLPEERRELLVKVLAYNEDEATDDFEGGDDLFHLGEDKKAKKKVKAKRMAGKLSELAGGQDMAYVEQNRSKNRELKNRKKGQNPFMKKLHREQVKRRDMLKDPQ